MDTELNKRLQAAALKASHPFCYGCYKRAETGKCLTCGSDDLMREVPGVGVEYGTAWVIKHLLEQSDAEITDDELERRLCESLDECHEPYRIGSSEFAASQVLKELDPVSFRCELADQHSHLIDNEQAFEYGGKLYCVHAVESLLEDLESESSGVAV